MHGMNLRLAEDVYDALLELACMASIVRYSLAGESGGRDRILFANPH
jgi:hypothetical protein